MKKRELKYLLNILFLSIAVIAFFVMRTAPHQNSAVQKKGGFFYVSRVVDGDTIKLSSGDRVRLIGIDTPESRYNNKLERDSRRSRKDINAILEMGKEASNFTRNLVEGKRVRLEYDVEKHDRYGRLLGYVYLEDGTFVNAKIMEEGYAQVMTIPPNVRYSAKFIQLQREAREKGRGLWKNGAEKELF